MAKIWNKFFPMMFGPIKVNIINFIGVLLCYESARCVYQLNWKGAAIFVVCGIVANIIGYIINRTMKPEVTP